MATVYYDDKMVTLRQNDKGCFEGKKKKCQKKFWKKKLFFF